MKTSFTDSWNEMVTVEAGDDSIAADGEVRVFACATERTIQHDTPASALSFHPAQARALAVALLRAADEAEGRTPPLGWFADLTDEDERNPEYPWQPFFQDNVGCFPLPLWFATESECNEFIRGEIVGRGFLPGEGK